MAISSACELKRPISMSKVTSSFGMSRLPSAWLVLAGSLLLTAIGWKVVQDKERETAEAQFAARTNDVKERIQQRMQSYEYLLRGGAALYSASKSVDRNAWHDYVSSLRIDQYMGGIQGIGYAPMISDSEKKSLIAQIRSEGFPDFAISPPGQRNAYAPVIYIEPFRGANLRAFGFDMYSETLRREAMERARDADDIALSGKVTLVQESGEKKQAGFLMYFPVYRNGMRHDDMASRRSSIQGFVYSPFRMDDLMEGIVGRSIPDLDVHIYDGEEKNPSALMFDSFIEDSDKRNDDPEFTSSVRMLIGGHHWLVTASSLPSFEREARSKSPAIIFDLGLFISLLLFFIVRFQEYMRARAERLAEQMTFSFQESERQLKAILDNSPYIAWLKDAHGRFLRVNKRYVEYSGRKAEDIIGKTDLDLWPKAYADKYRLDDAEVINSRRPKHVEEQTTDGDELHWMETFKTPVFGEDGKVVATAGFAQDISERKLREERITRITRLYELLSRANEAIVRVKDRDELFKSICKIAEDSMLFRLVWIGMLDEKREAVIPVAYAGAEEGYTKRLNIRLNDERTGNGPIGIMVRTGAPVICDDIENDPIMEPWRDEALKRGYLSSSGFPINDGEGNVVGVLNTYAEHKHFFTPEMVQLMTDMSHDVSFALNAIENRDQRQKAEEEIRQLNRDLERKVQERTRQLEEVNRELEAFSYSVSHDLRAPLRSIDGFSQILAKKLQDQLDETGRDYMERVRRASQRMGQLIDDLLRLARVTRTQIKREQIDLSAIAMLVMDEIRKTDPSRQVSFVVQPDLFCYADPGLMRVVLDNLLGNAYKFTGKKSDARIEFGSCEREGEQAFFVRDNGAGFNMDYAQKLFGAFQRLHGTDEFSGTGIGLATVQRIVHRHQGKIWAEAKEGMGANFYFTIPQRIAER